MAAQTIVRFVLTDAVGDTFMADGTLSALDVGASTPVSATITIPTTIKQGTNGQLTVMVNPGCAVQESDCTNDTFPSLPVVIGIPAPIITGVSPSPLVGPTVPGVVFGGTVVITGQNFQGGSITTDGPLLLVGSATVNAAGTVISQSYTIGCCNPVDGQVFHFVVTTPVGMVSVQDTIALSAATITVTSSRGNTTLANQVELNGLLTETLTLTATRSDNITSGSVSLILTDAPQVVSNPMQFTSVPYGSPQPADFTAALDASGNVSAVPTTVVVTPSQASPVAGATPTTLYFNVGDINLSGAPTCVQVVPGGQAQVGFTFQLVNSFNAPNLSWQWSGLTSGVSVVPASGNATFSGSGYSPALPTFTFTNSNANPIAGTQTFLFAVTVTDSRGGSSATKVFGLNFDLSPTPCPAGAAVRSGGGRILTGTWSRGGVGGMARTSVLPVQTAALPDLQINATSLSFTPSIPKPGDTVAVRFRVSNSGNAAAQNVPVALVVNGVTVASQTFNLRAGASTLAGLEWTNARPPSGSRSLAVAVVVDPNHTVQQKTALAKSAPLAHFAFLSAWAGQTGTISTTTQRLTLEVADGGCVGFRFASGAGSPCGSADVEITVEGLASGRYSLSTQIGIADLGSGFSGPTLAGVQYQQEVSAVAGHTYAVQLRGGKTGILRLLAIRNPAQTSAKGRQVFGAGNAARVGETTGPVETGDVSGVRTANQTKVYFDVTYQTQ